MDKITLVNAIDTLRYTAVETSSSNRYLTFEDSGNLYCWSHRPSGDQYRVIEIEPPVNIPKIREALLKDSALSILFGKGFEAYFAHAEKVVSKVAALRNADTDDAPVIKKVMVEVVEREEPFRHFAREVVRGVNGHGITMDAKGIEDLMGAAVKAFDSGSEVCGILTDGSTETQIEVTG